MTLYNYAAINARMDADEKRRAAERADRYIKNPDEYLKRRAQIGWKNDVPHGVTPPEDLEAGSLPGYKFHLSVEAITDAILELRAEKKRAARHNEDERIAIKSEYNRVFADVGLRLVNIPNWNRWERAILNPRLR